MKILPIPNQLSLALSLTLALAAAWTGGLLYAADGDDDDSLGADQLPQAVTRAVRKTYSQGALTSIQRDGRGDDAVYRMLVRIEGEDNDVWLKVVADGSILEIEESLRKEDVPPAVLRALKRAFPRGEIEHLDKRSRIEVVYELEIREGRRRREVKITPRGKIVEVERK